MIRQHEIRSAALRLVPEGAFFYPRCRFYPLPSSATSRHSNLQELQRPSPRRMNMVSRRPSSSVRPSTSSAVSGYSIFRDSTADDIFKNFAVKSSSAVSVIMNIVRLGFCVSIVLSYPLMVWEARHNIDILALGRRGNLTCVDFSCSTSSSYASGNDAGNLCGAY